MRNADAVTARMNRWLGLSLAAFFVVGFIIAATGALTGRSEAREVEWPIQVRYTIAYYLNGQSLAEEVHEFRATDWRNWMDVIVRVDGDENYRSQPRHVQRLTDDVYMSGWLKERPQEADDGFLADSVYAGFPENAIHVTSEPAEGQMMAPNAYFNGAKGRAAASVAHVRSEPGSQRAEELVATRLGLNRRDVASQRRIVAACEAGTLDACGNVNATFELVFHEQTAVPLEVLERMPDGTSTLMQVIALK
jgi:hypothetical protein